MAQAKFIARLVGSRDQTQGVMTRGRDGAEPYNDPTVGACIKYGWLMPTTDIHDRNGFQFTTHLLTDEGVDALEDFLRLQRFKRTPIP